MCSGLDRLNFALGDPLDVVLEWFDRPVEASASWHKRFHLVESQAALALVPARLEVGIAGDAQHQVLSTGDTAMTELPSNICTPIVMKAHVV